MNEQLQAELTKIITNINNGAETAWGFISEQTPGIIQQLLLWHGMKSFILLLLGILFLIITFFVVKKSNAWVKKTYAKYQNDCDPWELLFGIPILSGLIGTLISIDYFYLTWLQIWVAPKVWLLEYVSNMIK